ncbi:MAG: putative toxin-antitoxin system toxin component, PIN family [Thermomicrobiales bacterium]
MSESPVRVIYDANVFVSFLLSSRTADFTVRRLIVRMATGEVELLAPDELLEELERSVKAKSYLRERILIEDLERLVVLVRSLSLPVSPLQHPLPSLVRDAKDDYLLAYAFAERAHFLVTGDNDLLSLNLPEGAPRIVSPQAFLEILDRLRQGPPER